MMANATIAEWRDRALRAEAALEAMQANWADAKEKSKQAVERARTSQREAEAEIERLRAACHHVVTNCYCQPSGQHCDVCRPAALALMEEVPDGV